MPCIKLRELNQWEVEKLKIHIERNRYYLCERYHKDIDFQTAELDFLINHLPRVAKEMRREYCSHLCPLSGHCPIALGILSRDSLSG